MLVFIGSKFGKNGFSSLSTMACDGRTDGQTDDLNMFPENIKTAKRLNILKLIDSRVAEEFAEDLDGKLADAKQGDQTSVEEK